MRYLFGFVCVCALGVVPLVGCTESEQQEPDLEWPPNATAYFDQYGILHADCAFDEDCAMVLGYYHAADRFVQMDLARRFVRGRLSDMFGKDIAQTFGLVEDDASNRALFSTRSGVPGEEALLEQASPKVLAMLEAYSAGVNQWIEDLRNGQNGAVFPAEFSSSLFAYGPDRIPDWTVLDCLAFTLAWMESGANHEFLQVTAGESRAAVNDDAKFSDFWSRRPIRNSVVMGPDWTPPAPDVSSTKASVAPSTRLKQNVSAELLNAAPALQRLRARLESSKPRRDALRGRVSVRATGSNAWAVGPSRSSSGNTLVANDSHLPMTQPINWYLAHLDAKTHGRGQVHAAGFTAPGLPWFVLGQNEDIVWTSTAAFADLSDVYIEELVKDSQGNPTGVMFQGAEVPFTRVPFTVVLGDGATEQRELLFVPHHGPVRELDVEGNVAITLRWAGQDATTDPEFQYRIIIANNVDEARTAMENATALAESRVMADTQGNIGWFPYNRIPKRTWATDLDGPAPPWLPLDGTGPYEWTEYFNYAELPQLLNPEQGFVATANNDMTGALSDGNPTTLPSGEFHPPYQVDVSPGYRHGRIVELIEEIGSEHTLGTMYRIQNDVRSTLGEEMVPGILAIAEDEQTSLSPEARKVVNALNAWQFSCPTGLDGLYSDSPLTSDSAELLEASGCAAFHATLQELCELIHDEDKDGKDDDDLVAWEGDNCPTFAALYSIIGPDELAAGDVYWDDPGTPETETKHQVMAAALANVYDLLANERGLGSDETEWAWGRVHGLVLSSLLADVGIHTYDNPTPGGTLFANAGGHEIVASAYAERDLTQKFGAHMRLVCEMEPGGPVCSVQLAGGQSAHVDSPNYEDLLLKFLVNEPIELVFDIDRAKAEAVRTVTFD